MTFSIHINHEPFRSKPLPTMSRVFNEEIIPLQNSVDFKPLTLKRQLTMKMKLDDGLYIKLIDNFINYLEKFREDM